MPYITKEQRAELATRPPQTAGELNYLITQLCIEFVKNKKHDYHTMNQVMGALSSSQAEFYRRAMVPYEGKKAIENGDLDWPDAWKLP